MTGLAGQLAHWPTPTASVAVVAPAGLIDRAGTDEPAAWASVTKLVTALTVLRLAEEGVIGLDEPAGPPGSTARHLLAHTSGLTRRTRTATSLPGSRRVYSNAGYEWLAEWAQARTSTPFAVLVTTRVLAPLGLSDTRLAGSAAAGAVGPIGDLARLADELLNPRVFSRAVVELLATPAYPGLAGELPGFGEQAANEWGLGAEVRGTKSPHWTAPENAPQTFGHFGQSGSFLWVDPVAGLACVSLAHHDFGPWATDAWPRLSSYVLSAY